jgi:hypothetical protein
MVQSVYCITERFSTVTSILSLGAVVGFADNRPVQSTEAKWGRCRFEY